MRKLPCLSTLGLLLCSISTGYAAKPLDLSREPTSILTQFTPRATNARTFSQHSPNELQEISSEQDGKGTTHIRIKQFYQGIPVWQGNAILHVPNQQNTQLSALVGRKAAPANTTMNGLLYQDINQDLATAPTSPFNATRQTKALNHAMESFQKQHRLTTQATQQTIQPIIWIDKKQTAHYAYLISFLIQHENSMPKKPTYIMDALTLTIYSEWDDVKTLETVQGGGIGGNEGAVGKVIYDGATGHFPALSFQRDPTKEICYLTNAQLVVVDKRNNKTPEFSCAKPDPKYNNVFWNTKNDYANGGYSPNNDAIYSDYIVRKMYMDWFNIVMLRQDETNKNDRTPWKIKMITHDPQEGQNAWWLDGTMAFGEGDDESYPVVAPSVVAHELSHGFTQQQSGLIYHEESGGLNESFSDMADKAIEYYVYGKNEWTIDPELLKVGGRLLRYMDEPTKDCRPGKKPGDGCSIASYRDYNDYVNVHHSSGIFNRAFYLLSQKWNTKKAFEVMVHANRFYWTPTTTFKEAACGVMKSAQYYQYDVKTVSEVMAQVDVNTHTCRMK